MSACEHYQQQISQMLDGELPQDQARFLRRRLQHDAELSGCFERWQVCGDVLRGAITPSDCPLFGHACTPEHPVGPCMVSSEGSCAAYYRYRN